MDGHHGPWRPKPLELNLTKAYPELEQSRKLVPDVVQFYGIELDLPGMDHHTLIFPRNADEGQTLFEIESRFDANEVWPIDPARRPTKRLEALAAGYGSARREPVDGSLVLLESDFHRSEVAARET